MKKKKVASSACNWNNHTSPFPRGKLHTSACSRNVFLTTSCLAKENSRKPLIQGPNFNKIIFTVSSRTFFKLYCFLLFFMVGVQWWKMQGLWVQVRATALICVKAAVVLPTIVFVPLIQSQCDQKGKWYMVSLTLKTPWRSQGLPEVYTSGTHWSRSMLGSLPSPPFYAVDICLFICCYV